MRKTQFLMVILSLLLSLVAMKANAQGKKISLSLDKVPLPTALRQVEVQSEYYKINYSYDETSKYIITTTIKGITAPEAVKAILNGLPFIFSVNNEFIQIRKTNQTTSSKQFNTVSGRVLDADGEPLVGVTVMVVGSSNATVTDANGNYILSGVAPDQTLSFSYIGKKTLERKAPSSKNIVILHDELNTFSDVIVTGYQTISRERATGAFGTMTSQQLDSKLNANLKNIIEGQIAGVVLDKNGNISIRGISTLIAESNPLIVVDGYPTELLLNDLNPDNIENITVLKDGVAASIYGSRAANGVIVVTTKLDKRGKGMLSYKGSFRFETKPNLDYLQQVSTSDFIDAELALYDLSPTSTTYSLANKSVYQSPVIKMLTMRRAGLMNDEEFNRQINELRQINGLKDVEKNMFRTAFTQTHNLRLSGGNEINSYNLALNYMNNRSSFINTHDNRILINLKNEWNPYKFLKIGFTTGINYSRSRSPIANWDLVTGMTQFFRPYERVVDENGNLTKLHSTSYAVDELYKKYSGLKNTDYNPIQEAYDSYNTTQKFTMQFSSFLKFNITNGLSAEVGGNWSRSNIIEKSIYEEDCYMMRLSYNNSTSINTPSHHYVPNGDMINETRYTNENWTLRTQINYTHDFGKHHVNALAGNEIRRITSDNNQYETRLGYNQIAGTYTPINIKDFKGNSYTQDMIYPVIPIAYYVNYGSYGYADRRFVSWYFNGSYEYDNRYLVSGSIREDLTNFFGTDPKYRHKPIWSVGGTWKIKNEAFFNIPWINRMNLRASYGINGNISLTEGPDLILSTGNYSSDTEGISYGIASFPNNQLRWEKTATTNVGFDLDLLDNRLGITFDYYLKKSTDLLANDATDPTTGALKMNKNVGAIDNNGYELSIHGTPISNKYLKWNVVYNISFNHSKVKKYNVSRLYPTVWAWTNPIHAEGYPMYSLFGYQFAGLNNKGESMVYAPDGSKKLASAVTVDDIHYLGTTVPKTEMSLTNNFAYRNFNLSFMFIGKFGHKYRKDVFHGANYLNRHFPERWQKPGDENHTIYPVLKSWSMDTFYFPFCDVNIGNASYVKLRDITLTYNFPSDLIYHIGISDARIYLQARNLFRITASDCDIDPETYENNMTGRMGASSNAGYTVLPMNPEFYIGLSFSF